MATPNFSGVRPIIESYGPGRFRVSGVKYEGSIIVLPQQVLHWPIVLASEITLRMLAPVTASSANIEILVLGCGSRLSAIIPTIKNALKAAEIALEVMDTAAACRTYNVLAGEGRRVGAALLALR